MGAAGAVGAPRLWDDSPDCCAGYLATCRNSLRQPADTNGPRWSETSARVRRPIDLDIVALYLNQPNKAIVLCIDEKSQIQFEPHRSDPAVAEVPVEHTHDYKRNGTITLLAASESATGRATQIRPATSTVTRSSSGSSSWWPRQGATQVDRPVRPHGVVVKPSSDLCPAELHRGHVRIEARGCSSFTTMDL